MRILSSSSSVTSAASTSTSLRRPRTMGSSVNWDRFIPNPATMDWDYAQFMMEEARSKALAKAKAKPSDEPVVVLNDNYQKQLAHLFNMNRPRILTFNAQPHPRSSIPLPQPPPPQLNLKPPRTIPQTPSRTLDAPDLSHDFSLNTLDWGPSALAIALSNTLYLWSHLDSSTSQLLSVSEDIGPITSLSWSPNDAPQLLAVGLNNSQLQLWDPVSGTRLRTLKGPHPSRLTSLAWNSPHVLTVGGADGLITNSDTRIRSHIIHRYRGHRGEVCGLKWSPSGRQLASGATDHLLHLWDISATSSNSPTRWLHRFRDHTATVKALAWSPFQPNLLASGGADGDCSIKFWNTHTAACLNSLDAGSPVSALLWNKKERELLSSHGYSRNQLTLWKYPSMRKITDLTSHTSTVLCMTQRPNGCTVATVAADETLRFWDVFGTPEVAAKPPSKVKPEPFAHICRIR